MAKMPPVSEKKSPAIGGEAKKKRRVLVRKKKRRVLVRKRSHGGPGKKTQAVRGEVAAGSSQIQMQMPMKKKDGKQHEIRKKSGPASSPGPAVGGSPGSVHKKLPKPLAEKPRSSLCQNGGRMAKNDAW